MSNIITVEMAFELVQSGNWSLTQFTKWVDAQKSAEWSDGYDDGRLDGYNAGYDDHCG